VKAAGWLKGLEVAEGGTGVVSRRTGAAAGAGVTTRAPSAVLPGHRSGKAVRGALAVVYLTNRRSGRVSRSEVHAPAVPGSTPQVIMTAGAMSHAGIAGFPASGEP
jgi:hypothetical protein